MDDLRGGIEHILLSRTRSPKRIPLCLPCTRQFYRNVECGLGSRCGPVRAGDKPLFFRQHVIALQHNRVTGRPVYRFDPDEKVNRRVNRQPSSCFRYRFPHHGVRTNSQFTTRFRMRSYGMPYATSVMLLLLLFFTAEIVEVQYPSSMFLLSIYIDLKRDGSSRGWRVPFEADG